MNRTYELVYVVSPDATEEQVAELHTQVEEVVQRMAGTLDKTENWGRRRLAYEIGLHKEGTYVLETILGNGELMKELERRLRVSDLVLRYLVVRVDEEHERIARAQARRSVTSRRRRVTRGLPPDRRPGEGQRAEGDDDADDRTREGVQP